MPKISFFTRSNNDALKSHVLYCRVRCNGSVSEFSTKQKIDLKYWNQPGQKYKSKNKVENLYIETLIDKLTYKLRFSAIHSKTTFSAKELISESFLSTENKVLTMMDIVLQYVEYLENNTLTKAGTILNHRIKIKNLKTFESEQKTSFTAESFDCVVAEKYLEWFCSSRRTINVTTANRNILFFRMACIWALKKGKIKCFSLMAFQGKKDKNQDPIFLTESEFQSVLNANFESDYLTRIKDLFIFQCVTGLSYADIWNDFSILAIDGKKAIQGSRNKNQQAFFIPLSPIAENILLKYENKLPRYCNAVYNRMIKEIMQLCNIKKKVSTHTARKTFATLKNDEGWTRESISMMLGHSSVKTTEIYYLGKSFQRIENEMRGFG